MQLASRPGPDAERALAVIRRAGGRPMLVGGYVRDAIMNPGAVSKDIDVEVYRGSRSGRPGCGTG